MGIRRVVRRQAIVAAGMAIFGQGALAQEPITSVVVLGKRASMMSAQENKRDSADIVDSVLADDIHKLPDISVTDALQRITGVQITRDRGEGANTAIRGLTQMETTLNGREVFTAGSGRNLDFADFPSEMVAGIHVYKSASAERIEGGVGGAIDLRTRRPFDFKEREIVASARLMRGDLVKSSAPQFSVLASDRWTTAGGGQFGALVNLVHQKRAWREDQKSVGTPTTRNDQMPGTTVVAPGGTSETTSLGQRERNAATLSLQWRPVTGIELYADASYARFRTLQDSYQLNGSATSGFVPGSVALFPGTADVRRVTWINAPLSVLSFARDTADITRQAAIGGQWRGERLTLKADLSQSSSSNSLFFSGPTIAASAANLAQDLTTRVPGSSVSGTDLLNPANFRYTGVAYRVRPFDGKLNTAQADGEYRLAGGFFETLFGGLRYAKRDAGNAPGLVFGDVALSGTPIASVPGGAVPTPISGFFGGETVSSIFPYLVGNIAAARDAVALRHSFGIDTPLPTASSPLGLWAIGETTQAAYLSSTFKGDQLPLDGNLGVRMVRTHEAVSGSRNAPGSTAVLPVQVDSTYTDYLPSLNLRYRLSDGVQLRTAASKGITRPNFDQLSPSVTLVPNAINPALNQGGAGNPDLKPVRSNNLDFAVEKYVKAGTALTLTAFLKRVDGFVTNVSNPETYDGVTYQISRPQNGLGARIKGLELGYQQFFDFLPGQWRSLGMQANYTYVDSKMPNAALGQLPLQNLSKNSANLIGIFENDSLSARMAWNWRSKFFSSLVNVVGVGALPVYTRSYAWLDASLTYRVNQRVSVAFEGSNLLRTIRSAYYGVETRPQSAWLNDRQFGVIVTIRY